MLTGLDIRGTHCTGTWLVAELTFATERREKDDASYGDAITEEYRNVLSLTVYTDWHNITNVDSVIGSIGTITAIASSFNGAPNIWLKPTIGTGFGNWRQLKSGLRPVALPGGDGMRQTVSYASVGTWADLDWDTATVVGEPMILAARKIDTVWNITGLDNSAEVRNIKDTDKSDELEEGRNVLTLTREKILTRISQCDQFKTGLYTTPIVQGSFNGGPERKISPGDGFSNFLITEFAIMPTGPQGSEMCIVSERHEVATAYSETTWSD